MNARDLWPYRRFVMETTSTPRAAERLLSAVVSSDASPTGRHEWLGTVSGGGFEIKRRIDYRNTFLPVIEGQFLPAPVGARVAVTMRMHPSAVAFISVWLGITTLFSACWAFAGAPAMFASGHVAEAILSLLMPLFGVQMVARGFVPEARRAERFMREVFPPAPGHRQPFR